MPCPCGTLWRSCAAPDGEAASLGGTAVAPSSSMSIPRTMAALLVVTALGCRHQREEEKPVADPPAPPAAKDPREPMRDSVQGGGSTAPSPTAPGQSGNATGMVIDAGVIDAVAAEVPAAK